MYSLFISTYDKLITIGLLKDNNILEKLENNSNQNHSALVMPMIDSILKNNNLIPKDLNQIIVVNGPGSFTGVRIGVTIAKTLAYTLKIDIKTITSLELYAVSNESENNKLVSISDHKGKYVGYFNKNNELIDDLVYLNNSDYEKYIEGKKDYIIESKNINLEKVYNYLKNKKSINPHMVNPIYIKSIEALNDK